MLIIINFCLAERCGRNVVFLEMENTSVQVIVTLLIFIFESPHKMLNIDIAHSSRIFGGMLHIRSGLSLTFLATVASEHLQNYKASHLISHKIK